MQRGNAAVSQCPRKTGVLRPDTMFRPDFRGHRRGRFIAVTVRRYAGRRIVAEMAVHIDNTGRDIFAGAVDNRDLCRNGRIRTTDRRDLSARHEHGTLVDPSAFTIEDSHTGNRGGNRRIGFVSRRKRRNVRLARFDRRRAAGRICVRSGSRATGHQRSASRQCQQSPNSHSKSLFDYGLVVG